MKFILFAAIILFSCSQTPDSETIRLYVHASEVYANGNFSEAAEILSNVRNFNPALLLRVKAEYFSGDIEKAEKTCRRLLKIQPSSYEARLYLARIHHEKGDLINAVKLTELLLADNPHDIRTLRLAAELASENGKYDEALSFLDRACELSAESSLALLDRARLRWIAGKNTEAMEDLSRAKAMLPWDTPLLRSISNLEKIIMETVTAIGR